jgi:hypothetical protein
VLANFSKTPNIKFHEIPFSGYQVVACGQTDGQDDMETIIVEFLKYLDGNPPKNVVAGSREVPLWYSLWLLYL